VRVVSEHNAVFVPGRHHMELASGRYLDLLNPDPGVISLHDIANHLSQINRYTGAARRPMSVAEHAVLVADRVHSQGHGVATVLRALHHDDAEAYVGDVGRPLKAAIASVYGAIEASVDRAIAIALGLPDLNAEGWAAVKAADDWALAAEAWHLLPSHGRGWFCDGLYDPEDVHNPPAAARLHAAAPWGVRTSRRLYLSEHHRVIRTLRWQA
jgi:hypothetical protein